MSAEQRYAPRRARDDELELRSVQKFAQHRRDLPEARDDEQVPAAFDEGSIWVKSLAAT